MKKFLQQMATTPHVAGFETKLAKLIEPKFATYTTVTIDKMGNLIAHKPGAKKTKNAPKVMVCAHMDEIGMMVTQLCDDGFVKFTRQGGIDKRNILATEVTIHGKEPIYGVIGIKPPHLTSPDEMKKSIEIKDMAIDTGFSKEKLEKLIRVGDIITFNQEVKELKNGKLAGRALDDTAGIAAMFHAAKALKDFNHNADVYFVASAQEEVGCRGATTVAYDLKPDIAIIVDVGFANMPGLSEDKTIKMGDGPAIGIGPNINRKLFDDLKKVAKKHNTKHQIEVLPHMSGTDTEVIQITEGGVITALLSIPLKYMHSTVETVDIADIKSCGKLIADYIMSLQDWNGEEEWF
ncbi:MAG: M42 family metallopeptidase [Turicibacter sp.]|nr:M42 family metallopeptidase [Turicibacter sp.]